MAIIGIDLGTTNSLAAHFGAGGPVIIPNAYGESLTPSVVSVSGELLFVGKIAKERLITHPELTAQVFKRAMGTKKEYKLGNKTFLPEELSSLVIKRLREDAELFLNEPVDEAVISVPAYFSDAQRRATKVAGELAGLKVGRIVNEPTAAAVAYGLHEKKDYTKYLVLDLGGGTFDVSVLEKYGSIMEVRAVAGDNYLGGEDFTETLVSIFARRNKLEMQEIEPMQAATIRKAAEAAKRAFADSGVAVMSCKVGGENMQTAIDAKEYGKKCEPLYARLREPIKRAISDASVSLKDIDTVLFVGGATKLPLVRSFVLSLLGVMPVAHLNPDEVVALGAAVHSALKARNEALTEIVLTDVCPYTLGTSISVLKQSGFYEPGHYLPIIERNSVVPISRVERVYTLSDNQRAITVKILQGESRKTADNIAIGEVNISVPPAPAGEQAVDIRYTYDINGILEVEVTVVSTSASKKVVIEQNPGVMSKEEIARRLKELENIKIHPREKEEFRYIVARGERLFEESLGDTRLLLGQELQRFDDISDKQDERALRDFCAQFKELLDSIEGNYEF